MPNKGEILSSATHLPIHSWTSEPNAEKMWIGKEHGVTFKLSKMEPLTLAGKEFPSYLVLSTTGEERQRDQVKKDFTLALGDPSKSEIGIFFNRIMKSSSEVLIWETAKSLIPSK